MADTKDILNQLGSPNTNLNDMHAIKEAIGGGGGGSYSTDAKKVGKWIDGRDVMQKTVYVDELPNVTSATIDTVEGVVIAVEGFAQSKADDHQTRPLPFVGGGVNDIRIDQNGNSLRIWTYATWSSYCAYVTYKYIVEE